VNGNLNLAGIRHPVVDTLVDQIPEATSREELIPLVNALDRVLLWQHYIVPNWHTNHYRLAVWNKFRHLDVQPPYSLGFEHWWLDAKPASAQENQSTSAQENQSTSTIETKTASAQENKSTSTLKQ
jgi:ABC-type oligopeptide transport system substrate-binding subunit